MSTNTTTIVLVDSHPVVRLGLRIALEADPEFQIVGEAANGLDSIRLVEHLAPQILITDLITTGITGLALLRQLRKRANKTRVIVFTQFDREADIRSALKDGVSGYLMKHANVSEVVEAAKIVAAGGRFLGESVAEKVLLGPSKGTPTAPSLGIGLLTDREKQVLKLAAEGQSCTQIGECLHISPRTVESHRIHLMRKLGLQNLSELIRYAIQCGMLPVDL